ncbi:MAG: M20/M25/M40 family metallo-hydrolase [Candidatus Peribacteraceae bacterium]|nr:M20/M25/M40 family metallo-hydrolase [Candidatus Peribacteraceae bacterium]MDD5075195.1 M20/M25/M40 family metallo-hydrolase [Candidatus Peribacteraceae bacterium]
MPEFPSARELLGELVARESHTPKGARALAEFIENFARHWDLGAVTVHPYPPNAEFAEQMPPPVNMTIDINPENTVQPGEMLWYGHYDSIDPKTNYLPGYQGDPYQLTLDRNDPDIAGGLKSADQAAGLTSMLLAAQQLRAHRSSIRHSARCLLVPGEEGQSHGIYAALDPQNNLVSGSRCAISTDIEVGTNINDPPLICIGRPGRVGLRLVVKGKGMHTGNVHKADPMELVSTREALVRLCLKDIIFPQRDEQHFRDLMPPTSAVAKDWRAGDPNAAKQENMSIPHIAIIDVDVINGNPALDPASIIAIIRSAVDETLQRHGIDDPNVVTYLKEPGRRTPFIKPYLEHPDHTWVKTVMKCMQTSSGIKPLVKSGNGTAESGVIAHLAGISTVILPPICEGEHTENERVRLSSIVRNAATLKELALHPAPLTHVDYR